MALDLGPTGYVFAEGVDRNRSNVDALLDLIASATPDWHRDAACAGQDPALFFPEDTRGASPEALAFCQTCLVRSECLSYAVEQGWGLHGTWGGVSARSRSKLLPRSGPRREGRVCGTLSAYVGGCRCEPCREARRAYAASKRSA